MRELSVAYVRAETPRYQTISSNRFRVVNYRALARCGGEECVRNRVGPDQATRDGAPDLGPVWVRG
jgi:hypothetical protein